MAQFRNVSGDVLFVSTDRGLEKVEDEAILTVSDEFAAAVYFQTGETGETKLFDAVTVTPTTKNAAPAPVDTNPASAPTV